MMKKLKQLKQFMKNEKGFTLVEILVVIAIIAILFVTLLPQIDNAVNRSRETGVKTDFHTMQTAMETYVREAGGRSLTADTLNKYLDPGMEIKKKTAGDGLVSVKLDPWGKPYDVYVFQGERAIVFKSFGPDETAQTLNATTSDDYVIATYYHEGQVLSCTFGFDTNNVESTLLTGKKCGAVTPKGAALEATGAMKNLK